MKGLTLWRLLALALLLSTPGCERKVRGAANQDDVETPMPPPKPLRAGVSWQRIYAGAMGLSESAEAVTTDRFGNVLVGGSEGVRKRPRPWRQTDRGFLIKLDQEGRVLWRRVVGDEHSQVQHLATDEAGNVYVASSCCEVRKLSPGGRLLWKHQINKRLRGIAALPDGGAYVCAEGEWRNPSRLERLDGEGNLLWTRTVFPGLEEPSCAAVATASDGGVLVAAKASAGHPRRPVVMHLTADDRVLWQTQLDEPAFEIKRLLPLPDGRILVSTEDILPNSSGSSVLALAADGSLLWNRRLDTAASNGERLPELASGPDDRLLVVTSLERFEISPYGEVLGQEYITERRIMAMVTDPAGHLIEVGDTETRDVSIKKRPWPEPPSAPR
ncbi:MAG: PQQ-binding-like beta-propeller repeat protein [Deltaproteobacteria bacterium]|nr:PQQ-binding-like beta-propeller repeat protein [Deltaproteobacteria bacterium]